MHSAALMAVRLIIAARPLLDPRRPATMQTFKLLLTCTAVTLPDVLIMNGMGWSSVAHFAAIAAWALISTPLVISMSARHRRYGWPKRRIVALFAGALALGMLLLGTAWDVRAVIAVLLILPGVAYLMLETLGLTPAPATPGPLQ